MIVRRAALVAALLAPFAPFSLAAQGAAYGGPYTPLVLATPAGARTLAMGNTGVASRDDDAIFFNPAQIAIARGFSVSGERYSPTSGGGSLSAVTRFNTGGVAIGMRMVDYESPANRFPADRSTALDAGPAAGTSVEAVLAVAQVIKGIRVGGSAKYLEDNVSVVRAALAAFDVGLSKDVLRFYTVGLSVQNIGKGIDVPCTIATESPRGSGDCSASVSAGTPLLTTARLPLRTTLGVATARPLGEFDVVGTLAISALRTDYVVPSGGVEVGYSWLDGYAVALRAGARRPLPGEQALTAGVGFSMDRLSVDYALETLAGSRVGHRVGVRIR